MTDAGFKLDILSFNKYKEFTILFRCLLGLIGNPVKIGDGPASVIGDEHRCTPLGFFNAWEGAVSRKIQKSEDLPEQKAMCFPGKSIMLEDLKIKRDIYGSTGSKDVPLFLFLTKLNTNN